MFDISPIQRCLLQSNVRKKSAAKIKRTVCVLYKIKRHIFSGRIVNVFIENSQNLKLDKIADRRRQKC
jgi:hypothetical protein